MSQDPPLRVEEEIVVRGTFHIDGFPVAVGHDDVDRIGSFKGHKDFEAIHKACTIQKTPDFHPQGETRLIGIFLATHVVQADADPGRVEPFIADDPRFSIDRYSGFLLLEDFQDEARLWSF